MSVGQGKRERKNVEEELEKKGKGGGLEGRAAGGGSKAVGRAVSLVWPETLPVNMLCDPGGSLLLDLSGPVSPLK